MTEKNDYQIFRKNVIKHGDRCDRVENLCTMGMPDVNLCLEGVESWVELKSPKVPVRLTTPLFGSGHGVSVEQRNWHKKQWLACGRSYFLVCTDRVWVLINGSHGDHIGKMPLNEMLQAADWSATKPISLSGWQSLREVLVRS